MFSPRDLAQKPNNPYQVLVADDSEDDRFMLRRALRVHSTFKLVAEACNGEEAIQYLNGTGIFSDREKYPFPDLLLLDLRMPRVNGYEVLRWLGKQSFGNLKVVIFSGSIMEKDIHHCLELGADAYYAKMTSREDRAKMFQEIEALLNRNKDSAQSRPEI